MPFTYVVVRVVCSAEDGWYWTWEKEGDDNAMQVDYVRVYKRSDLPPEQAEDCPA